MKNIETISLIRELEKYPVFNMKKINEITGKKSSYSKLLAYRLKKRKLITEIEKNKFTISNDSITIASSIIWPSYISIWTALRYYNLTEQLPKDIFVITTRKRKKKTIKFGDTVKIIFISTAPKFFFGYKKERYHNSNIFIAEKEKALIDSALFKKISFSEISEVICNNLEDINSELFLEYLLKIENKALIKRFGFLFDSLGIDFSKKVKKYISPKYIPLDYAKSAEGKKNKKWRIIENVKL